MTASRRGVSCGARTWAGLPVSLRGRHLPQPFASGWLLGAESWPAWLLGHFVGTEQERGMGLPFVPWNGP